jgi:hypothetical protein
MQNVHILRTVLPVNSEVLLHMKNIENPAIYTCNGRNLIMIREAIGHKHNYFLFMCCSGMKKSIFFKITRLESFANNPCR